MLVEASKTSRYRDRSDDSDDDDYDDDDEENVRRLTLNSSDEEDDEEEKKRISPRSASRNKPPRPSAIRRSSLMPVSACAARRRRSSARFLKFGEDSAASSSGGGGGGSHGRAREHSRKSLALIYSTEIKMNAENRINSANSWNFKLIENLDRLLTTEEDEDDGDNLAKTRPPRDPAEAKRIDFTRASCSIDASVRIYGYRVDDVHLTSYKVLANLHRSDTNNNKKKGKKDIDHDEEGGGAPGGGEDTHTTTRKKTVGPTVESNMANINLTKLDAAFDIDPLFHKMSKTFDEGGAKGLLLANLGTGCDGCNIIFDTPSDDDHDKKEEKDHSTCQKPMDATILLSKLEAALDGQPASSFSLVSQLSGLRVDFSELDEGGFVDTQVPITRTQRYAPEWEEEVEADKSIHQEALERSRRSLGQSFAFGTDDRSSPRSSSIGGDYADDDYGDYGADDGGFDDDFGVPLFPNDDGNRGSSSSFAPLPGAIQERQQTAILLEAISSGKLLGNSDYEYLDRQTLAQVTNNAWAGAAHWRPAKKPKKLEADPEQKPETEQKTQKCPKERVFVDLTFTPDMTDILRMPPKPRGKNRTDPLQFSSAIIAKHSSDDNTLPPDARLGVSNFSVLFLRPNAVVKGNNVCAGPTEAGKTVAWDMDQVQTFGGGDWDNGSFGGGRDDNDGPGFNFGGEDEENEYTTYEGLDHVRRVEKIRIGYATVAKKVDVKRLKQDLWTEIGHSVDKNEEGEEEKDDDNDNNNDDSSAEEKKTPPKTPSKPDEPLSFYNVVQKMEQDKKQADVSLPYYFICMLHLANEKNLRLESQGLDDFLIYQD